MYVVICSYAQNSKMHKIQHYSIIFDPNFMILDALRTIFIPVSIYQIVDFFTVALFCNAALCRAIGGYLYFHYNSINF